MRVRVHAITEAFSIFQSRCAVFECVFFPPNNSSMYMFVTCFAVFILLPNEFSHEDHKVAFIFSYCIELCWLYSGAMAGIPDTRCLVLKGPKVFV